MIAVVGLGGGGCSINAHISRMMPYKAFSFINIDSDLSSIMRFREIPFILAGQRTCRGWGSGNSTEVAEMALTESMHSIEEAFYGFSKVYILSTLGGGMGGAQHLLAKYVKKQGVEVISIVTRPFAFEGKLRSHIAQASINRITLHADHVVTYTNDTICRESVKGQPISDALRFFDKKIRHYILGDSFPIRHKEFVNNRVLKSF